MWRASILGACALLALATLFYPWLDDHVFWDWWRPNGTGVAVPLRALAEGETYEPVRDTYEPYPSAFDRGIGELGECIGCWRVSCDDTHSGPDTPVKPPWVPWWVMDWTLLVHVVPDYAAHCPDG